MKDFYKEYLSKGIKGLDTMEINPYKTAQDVSQGKTVNNEIGMETGKFQPSPNSTLSGVLRDRNGQSKSVHNGNILNSSGIVTGHLNFRDFTLSSPHSLRSMSQSAGIRFL